jgi:hypothetical protein
MIALRALARSVQDSAMRRTALSVLLSVALPACALAQRTSDTRSPQFSPAFGLHYGTPMRFSVSAGGMLDFNRSRSRGAIALIEQGQHGTEFSAGYFHMLGQFGSGYSLRGAVLRTSGEPWNADPHTTYVGGEVHLLLLFGVGGRAGFFRRASSTSRGDHDSVATLGVTIGA